MSIAQTIAPSGSMAGFTSRICAIATRSTETTPNDHPRPTRCCGVRCRRCGWSTRQHQGATMRLNKKIEVQIADRFEAMLDYFIELDHLPFSYKRTTAEAAATVAFERLKQFYPKEHP